jgi:hypothetical protein
LIADRAARFGLRASEETTPIADPAAACAALGVPPADNCTSLATQKKLIVIL